MTITSIKVLIADASKSVCDKIVRMLCGTPGLQVVGIAYKGIDTIRLTYELHPDVIILSLSISQFDGLTTLKTIMQKYPTPVLVVCDPESKKETQDIFKALELGAIDFITKPVLKGDDYQFWDSCAKELISKVDILAKLEKNKILTSKRKSLSVINRNSNNITTSRTSKIDVVAIGASTGGPAALYKIIPKLPANLSAAVLVVQHMTPGFTRQFSERLDTISLLKVKEAADGDEVLPGHVLIAPSGSDIYVEKRLNKLVTRVGNFYPTARYRPSIDSLMSTLASTKPSAVLGIILTGMGNDGEHGVKAIKKANGLVFVEAEENCVAYGMPRFALRTNAVDRVLLISEMVDEIVKVCSK